MDILTPEMRRVMREQRLGYVATVCPGSTPNLLPKRTVAVWDAAHLVFADIRSPQTIANLRANPAVEVNVVDPIARRGYRFKGTATIVTGGDDFAAIVAWSRRHGLTSPIRAVVLIRVARALPLVSPAYDTGASEAEVRRNWRLLRRPIGPDA